MNIDDYLSKQMQNGEEVVRIVRGHPLMMAPSVGSGGLLMLLDFFLIAWWFKHSHWGTAGFTVLMIIGIVLIIRGMYIWSHNVLAVTTQRVIDFDQQGLFERNVAEATYDKIQDVRYTIRGLWSTIFHFGTVIVQTAGTTTNLEIGSIKQPAELQQLIADLQRRARPSADNSPPSSELGHMVERLRAELGTEGVERLLHKHPVDHG